LTALLREYETLCSALLGYNFPARSRPPADEIRFLRMSIIASLPALRAETPGITTAAKIHLNSSLLGAAYRRPSSEKSHLYDETFLSHETRENRAQANSIRNDHRKALPISVHGAGRSRRVRIPLPPR